MAERAAGAGQALTTGTLQERQAIRGGAGGEGGRTDASILYEY